MKKPPLLVLIGLFMTCAHVSFSQTNVVAGRMKEVFRQTVLVPNNNPSNTAENLLDPWEVTYGPDDSLWVTEAKGYRIKKVHPTSGQQRTIGNLASTGNGGTMLPTSLRRQFSSTQDPWPQGGMMGLAIHPSYITDATKRFVYVAYVRSYVGNNQTLNGEYVPGRLFLTSIVRFTYANGQLGSGVVICDTIRGSNDHNSGRMIIAPYGGQNYLFYACGDMGAGQFDNGSRMNKAQVPLSYEGKILRFNLEEDADAAQSPVSYNRFIPNDNPYGVNSAVWSIGMRNNQGFVYNPVTGKLYGSSHGPHSDDELNLIERDKNYGHPIVEGYSADNNYNGSSAGFPGSSLPVIASETTNAANIGTTKYRDPIFSAYAPAQSVISNIYNNAPPNGGWPSEGWSGISFDSSTVIPGHKGSILLASLKWGRIVRLRLNAAGDTVIKVGGFDTTSFFGSRNRFRDLAMSPDGQSWFVVMDRSITTSGPSQANPVVTDCQGCLQKYTFLGYYASAVGGENEKSTIPTSLAVTKGTANSINYGRTVTINAANFNNSLWVPITGADGEIMIEVKAKSGGTAANDLGAVTSSYYMRAGQVREDGSKRLYLNRSYTIKFQTAPTTPIAIRLYFSKKDLDTLMGATNTVGAGSAISSINSISIRRNADAAPNALTATTTTISPTIKEVFKTGESYVVQFILPAGSATNTFYLGNPNVVLPLELVYFKGELKNNEGALTWQAANETNTKNFSVERSTDGTNFQSIGSVDAAGNSATRNNYGFNDKDILNQPGQLVYYRLKMVDTDGKFKYSSTVTLSISFIAGKVSVLPNPITTQNKVKVVISSAIDCKSQLKLTDNNGRVVYATAAELKKGNNVLYINVDQLSSGLYYLNVSGTGIDQRVKVQKL